MKRIFYTTLSAFILNSFMATAVPFAITKPNYYTTTAALKDTAKYSYKDALLMKYYNANQFADAAYNSIMTLNSLVKKENYRNKVAAFNNPANTDLGFSLNNEIHIALKPLTEKACSGSSSKLTGMINSLLSTQPGLFSSVKSLIPNNGVFNTITSIVGSWTMQERKISKNDFDTFLLNVGKYFGQYEKLNKINLQLDNGLDNLDNKINDLQGKLKLMMTDIFVALRPNIAKTFTENKSLEEMLMLFADKQFADTIRFGGNVSQTNKAKQASFIELQVNKNNSPYFPADAIKTAKEISNDIAKIYNDYQKLYNDNYNNMRAILLESKAISKTINAQQIDNTLAELLSLYNESKKADALNLRLITLRTVIFTICVVPF
ncbi:MAG: hypothetical protein NTZ59_07265 [Bacteroidetes bacterium]|nr:hypothetical protein [Bacteroidota bacterium]